MLNGVPKRLGIAHRRDPVGVSEGLLQAGREDGSVVLARLGSRSTGLTQEEAAQRLLDHGPNVVVKDIGPNRLKLFAKAVLNPLVVLLALLATISVLTGDTRAAVVMAAMIALGVSLRFVQEARADSAAKKLRAMIKVTATAIRDGQPRELPLEELVLGDIVHLSAGDMFPADVRLLSAKDLFVIQASLTGESLPVEKFEAVEQGERLTPLELRNVGYLGTSVESGTGTGVVVATGERTFLGALARELVVEQGQTAFDKGVARFTWLMIRFIAVMVPVVFVLNGLTKGDWREAFFFALAVAVGMTPEMLPMIVSVCLTKGALLMSRKKVIVKRLDSIQNLGAMDVLCTDKTGTLTAGRVVLQKHCDVELEEDDEVLALAYLNSHFQTGLKSLLDRAILEHSEVQRQIDIGDYGKADEIPFDFRRRLMSVVVVLPNGMHRLICKGAPEEVFSRCTSFEYRGEQLPLEGLLLDDLRIEHDKLSADGFRVLGIAYRDFEPKAAYSKADESELVLRGYAAFFDPPKDSARPALEALRSHGVCVKVLTGDSDAVSRKICGDVGIESGRVLLGRDVESMADAQLEVAAEEATLFARLAPSHKQRIVKALQRRRHVVGFLGDGINDSPALRAADVGISVDSAVDIAKESADLILLEMSLLVLRDGIVEGRKVFANILKYVRMGASSSFGNMFSVVGASAFLPFVPMAPLQILTNNLLYDFSQVPIPTDNVDPEQVALPRPWSMERIAKFILFIGPCSSVFDYTTYFLMFYVFGANSPARASLFQTGWFVESLLTQTLVIHVIRTNRVPFIQSRASLQLTLTTAAVMAVGIWLPYSPFAAALGFTALPPLYWPLVLVTLVLYVVLTQKVKVLLLRKGWI
ncbi:MAG TPA: magnesium-translocating P-type ATPase [Anaeromyxobacteraceae bacterium]|nr:magnesium-translocating P-type ATPase [Anaeromyxobacteraceae bacterium]